MSSGGRDAAPVAFRGRDDATPQADELGADVGQRLANRRPDLDLRFVELVGNFIAQILPRLGSIRDARGRSSRVSGLMIWYSSSTPMVKSFAGAGTANGSP